MHPVVVSFFINIASLVLKAISLTGTNATSVFIDTLNDSGDIIGLGLLLLGLRYRKTRQSIYYPFGTRRAMYVLGLFSIMLIGGLLFTIALFKLYQLIIEPSEISVATYTLRFFTVAFILNTIGLLLVVYWTMRGDKDPITTGTTLDSASDLAGSLLALVTLITRSVYVDIMGSLAISIVILISAFTIGYRYFQILVGRAPPKEVLKRVINRILEYPEVKDVNIFNALMITEDEYYLHLEIEVDKDMEIEDAEKLSQKLEEEIRRIEPRFKNIVVEFVSEQKEPKTYMEILSKIENGE